MPHASTTVHSHPVDLDIEQDDFTATLDTEAPMIPMNGLLGDLDFDLDDLWSRTFDGR